PNPNVSLHSSFSKKCRIYLLPLLCLIAAWLRRNQWRHRRLLCSLRFSLPSPPLLSSLPCCLLSPPEAATELLLLLSLSLSSFLLSFAPTDGDNNNTAGSNARDNSRQSAPTPMRTAGQVEITRRSPSPLAPLSSSPARIAPATGKKEKIFLHVWPPTMMDLIKRVMTMISLIRRVRLMSSCTILHFRLLCFWNCLIVF
ncbi:hypothetical protein AABB24_029861, partial [Solanum stoloniferum]